MSLLLALIPAVPEVKIGLTGTTSVGTINNINKTINVGATRVTAIVGQLSKVNYVNNSLFDNAIVGQPLPGWDFTNDLGLDYEITAVGTSSGGLKYVDIRIFGTTNNTADYSKARVLIPIATFPYIDGLGIYTRYNYTGDSLMFGGEVNAYNSSKILAYSWNFSGDTGNIDTRQISTSIIPVLDASLLAQGVVPKSTKVGLVTFLTANTVVNYTIRLAKPIASLGTINGTEPMTSITNTTPVYGTVLAYSNSNAKVTLTGTSTEVTPRGFANPANPPVVVNITANTIVSTAGNISVPVTDVSVTITGTSSTGSVGTITKTATVNINITGSTATGSPGNATTQQLSGVSLTNTSAASSVWNLLVTQVVGSVLTGTTETSSVSSIQASLSANATLSNVSFSSNVSSVTVQQVVNANITGVQATLAQSDELTSQAVQISLTGTSNTNSVGGFASVSSVSDGGVTFSGVSATGTVNGVASVSQIINTILTANRLVLFYNLGRTNLLHNSTMQGAVVGTLGSGGSVPTGWSTPGGSGITIQVVSTGSLPDGNPYIDIRWFGTNGTAGPIYPDLYPLFASNRPLVTVGTTISSGMYVETVAGSRTGFLSSTHPLWASEYSSNHSHLNGNLVMVTNGTRATVSRTVSTSNAVYGAIYLSMAIPAGNTVDITIRISQPQLEYGNPTTYMPTYGTIYSADVVGNIQNITGITAIASVGTLGISQTSGVSVSQVTAVGFAELGPKRNLIANSMMVGATSSTYPTGSVGNGGQGITVAVVGTGVDEYPYIDIRVNGTASSLTYPNIVCFDGYYPDVPAKTGIFMAASIDIKLIAGSLPNIIVSIRENRGNTYQGSQGYSASVTGTWNRFNYPTILTNPNTTDTALWLVRVVNAAETVDFTVRIRAPQLQYGGTVTAFIPTYGTSYTSEATEISVGMTGVATNSSVGTLSNTTNLNISGIVAVNSISSTVVSISKVVSTNTANSTVGSLTASQQTGVTLSSVTATGTAQNVSSSGDSVYNVSVTGVTNSNTVGGVSINQTSGVTLTATRTIVSTKIGRTNIVRYSNLLSDPTWTPLRLSVSSTTAPDGSAAFKLTANGTTDPILAQNVSVGTLANRTFTSQFILWTDTGQPTEATLFVYNNTVTDIGQNIVTLTTTPTLYTLTKTFGSTITDTSITIRIDPLNAGTNGAYIYAQKAQLEESGTASQYIETTTAAVTVGTASITVDVTGNTINSSTNNIFSTNGVNVSGIYSIVNGTLGKTNLVNNSTMQGVVTGTPGTTPTSWSPFTSIGLTRQVVAVGTDAATGYTYIDIRLSGTVGGTGIQSTSFDTLGTNVILATSTSTFTHSAYFGLVAGTWPTGPVNIGLTYRNALTTAIRGTSSNIKTAVTNSTLVRVSRTDTNTGDTNTRYVQPTIRFDPTAGDVVDFTIRIAAPQFEVGNLTAYVPTYGSSYSADVTTNTQAEQGVSAVSSISGISVGQTSGISIIGNTGTLTQGDEGSSSVANVNFTPLTTTVNTGTVQALSAINVSIVGHIAAGVVGSASGTNNFTVSINGNTSEITVQSLTPEFKISAASNQITTNTNNMVTNQVVGTSISGNTTTTTLRNIVPGISIQISNNSIVSSIGNVTPKINLNILGNTITPVMSNITVLVSNTVSIYGNTLASLLNNITAYSNNVDYPDIYKRSHTSYIVEQSPISYISIELVDNYISSYSPMVYVPSESVHRYIDSSNDDIFITKLEETNLAFAN